jgi:hypothetical protein
VTKCCCKIWSKFLLFMSNRIRHIIFNRPLLRKLRPVSTDTLTQLHCWQVFNHVVNGHRYMFQAVWDYKTQRCALGTNSTLNKYDTYAPPPPPPASPPPRRRPPPKPPTPPRAPGAGIVVGDLSVRLQRWVQSARGPMFLFNP